MEKQFELKQFIGTSNRQCTSLITVASYICFTSDYWQKLLFPLPLSHCTLSHYTPLSIIPITLLSPIVHYPIIAIMPHYIPLSNIPIILINHIVHYPNISIIPLSPITHFPIIDIIPLFLLYHYPISQIPIIQLLQIIFILSFSAL